MRNFEIEIVRYLRNIATPFLDKLMEFITFFGEQYILILVVAILYFMFNKRLAEKIAYTIFSSLLINNTIKGLLKSSRPFEFDETLEVVRKETATGYSFPSGHTQNASVTYFSLSYNYKIKKLWIISIIIISLIALSRIYLGVHFPSDVLVAIVLGLICAFYFSNLYELYSTNLKRKMIMYFVTIGAFTPFLLIFALLNSDLSKYRDFYISYALFLGFILAVLVENKYVNFDCTNPLKIRIIRLVVGLILILLVQFGLDSLFPEGYIILDMIRYFLITFVGLGLYPLITKKWFFYK